MEAPDALGHFYNKHRFWQMNVGPLIPGQLFNTHMYGTINSTDGREDAVADQLKSFRKDWQRWSLAERAVAVALVVAATLLLSGPFTLPLL